MQRAASETPKLAGVRGERRLEREVGLLSGGPHRDGLSGWEKRRALAPRRELVMCRSERVNSRDAIEDG